MRRFVAVAALLIAAASVYAGCAAPGGHEGVNGTAFASIYTSQNVPSGHNGATSFRSDGPGYTIVGDRMQVDSQAKSILGWIATGDTGYKNLIDKAKAAGADTVIDTYYDASISDILGIICTVDYHVYGTPIKFKK